MTCTVILFFSIYLVSSHSYDFPYQSSNSIQFSFDRQRSSPPQHLVYKLQSEEIEGEAIVTLIPSKSVALAIIESTNYASQSPFKNTTAPYGGHISREIDCPSKKYLKELVIPFNSSDTKLILAVANKRRTIGVCSIDEIEFVSATWATYDEKLNQLVVIKLFKSIAHVDHINELQNEMLKIFKSIIGLGVSKE